MYKYLLNRITVGLLFADSGKHVNGDARTKKHSVTDSVHSKRSRYSDVDEKGRLVHLFQLNASLYVFFFVVDRSRFAYQ